MLRKSINYLAPLLLLIAFSLDGQLTTLLINLSPGVISISSHLLLMVGIFCSFYLPLSYSLFLFAMLGFFYDIYYIDVIGMGVTLFPLVIYLVYYFYQYLKMRRVTNLIILIVVIFVLKFSMFLLARLFHISNLSMFLFVFYDLAPSLVFNSILLFLLHPMLEALFGFTNKT